MDPKDINITFLLLWLIINSSYRISNNKDLYLLVRVFMKMSL